MRYSFKDRAFKYVDSYLMFHMLFIKKQQTKKKIPMLTFFLRIFIVTYYCQNES